MFCYSNDTTLTSGGLACFENTHAKRSTYFGQKSWFPHVYWINVSVFKLSIKWTPGDVLRFQRHNPHLMWTRLLREYSCQTKHLFWPNSGFPHVCRINVPVFKLSIKWTPGMFRDSNDATLTACGLACFENTHAKRSTYLGQKPWYPHVCRINVPVFKLSIKWTPGDVPRFQRHNHHLMWTRLLREHSCQTKHLFWAKIMISPWVPDKREFFLN